MENMCHFSSEQSHLPKSQLQQQKDKGNSSKAVASTLRKSACLYTRRGYDNFLTKSFLSPVEDIGLTLKIAHRYRNDKSHRSTLDTP